MRRLLSIATLLAAILVWPLLSSAAEPAPAAQATTGAARSGDVLPDLRVEVPDVVEIERDEGRRLLRFSSEVANVGRGRLEITPRAEDCDRDGDRGNDRTAYQRVDTTRGADRLVPSGCMTFHPDHGHWHFEGFAGYALVRASTDRVVARSDKVSFCMIDVARSDRIADDVAAGQRFHSCGADDAQGISVGWADRYGAGLPGQELDVTGLADGDYRLVLRADPSRRLLERRKSNNDVSVPITLRDNRVRLRAGRGRRP